MKISRYFIGYIVIRLYIMLYKCNRISLILQALFKCQSFKTEESYIESNCEKRET